MFRHLVVPLDGSEFAAHALPVGMQLAAAAGASVRVLGVARTDAELAWTYDHVVADAQRAGVDVADVEVRVDPDPTAMLVTVPADEHNDRRGCRTEAAPCGVAGEPPRARRRSCPRRVVRRSARSRALAALDRERQPLTRTVHGVPSEKNRHDNKRKDITMALSDQLTKLAARANEVEARAAAAKAQAKADLEEEVKNAREAAQAEADSLHADKEETKGEISEWWDDVRKSWSKHTKDMRKHMDDQRSALDLKHAQKAAERADDDAAFAIDYAYAAIVEAEYAVLDSYLAHKEADELTQATSSS